MGKKLPESHPSHLNPDISYKNLRAILPAHWKIMPPRDDKSGTEYGQDWLVQMTDDDNKITGEEFRIQSKVIDQKSSKRRIGTRIKISTLNYLNAIPIPVMLHFFDNKAECGYWIWLEDWYAEHYSHGLEKKPDVTVYIPKKNKFDEKAVKQIRSRVQFAFRRMNILRKADVESALDPDYLYRTSFDPNGIAVSVYAKHDNPRPLSFRMELGEEANKTLQRAYERGEQVSFEGMIYHEGVLPDFLTSEDGIHEIIAIPHTPDKSFPARIEFFDDNRNLLYRIPYVLFHLTQDGTYHRRWEGLGVSDALLCILEEERVPEVSTLVQIRRNKNNRTKKAFSEFLEFRKRTVACKSEELTNIITDKMTELPVPEQEIAGLSAEGVIWDRFVQALTTIEKHTDIVFDMPENLTDKVLGLAEVTAEVVDAGKTYDRFGFLAQLEPDGKIIGQANKPTIQPLIHEFRETGKSVCFLAEPQSLVVNLLDHQIELGSFTYVLGIRNIPEIDELERQLEIADDEKIVDFQIELDWENTFVTFDKWLPQQEATDQQP